MSEYQVDVYLDDGDNIMARSLATYMAASQPDALAFLRQEIDVRQMGAGVGERVWGVAKQGQWVDSIFETEGFEEIYAETDPAKPGELYIEVH